MRGEDVQSPAQGVRGRASDSVLPDVRRTDGTARPDRENDPVALRAGQDVAYQFPLSLMRRKLPLFGSRSGSGWQERRALRGMHPCRRLQFRQLWRGEPQAQESRPREGFEGGSSAPQREGRPRDVRARQCPGGDALGGSDSGGGRRHRSSDARERDRVRPASRRTARRRPARRRPSSASLPVSDDRGPRNDKGGGAVRTCIDSARADGGISRASEFANRLGQFGIWNVCEEIFAVRNATFILDRCHAFDCAAAAVRSGSGQGRRRRGWKRIKQQLNDGRIARVIGGPEPHRDRDEAVATCIDCFGPAGVECAATFAANADWRSNPAAWKASASNKQTIGRRFKQVPTSCSLPNAASKAIAEPTSLIEELAAAQQPDQRSLDALRTSGLQVSY